MSVLQEESSGPCPVLHLLWQFGIGMALIHCMTCGQMISDYTPNCPRCGASNPYGHDDWDKAGLSLSGFMENVFGTLARVVVAVGVLLIVAWYLIPLIHIGDWVRRTLSDWFF